MSIIAEFSHNHLGDLNLLKDMVFAAANAGAKYCKIQTHFAADLTPDWKGQAERVKKYELDWDAHAQFVAWCRRAKVIPMTSVYTFRYAEKLNQVGFRHIKIGSAQAGDDDMVRRYLLLGFKVVLSTGGHAIKDIPRLGPLEAVLHCVSQYPTHPHKANLCRMHDLMVKFPNCQVGFSDHTHYTNQNHVAKTAILLGADITEKHFTLKAHDATKDGPVSVDPTSLADLCKFEKKSIEERLAESEAYGLFRYPQGEDEIKLIKEHKTKWQA